MQQFLFTVSSTYRSMLRMPVRESWPVDTSVGGLLMRRSVCPVSTTARPTRENLNRTLTTCVWSASLRLSLQPLLSRFVSNESCKVTYQIYFVLFQSIKNNCFILFSCIVSMFSIFTAPEIYWRKDGWVQESHLDFHFVQYARYNIKLVFFTLFLCCLILLWENGIKIKIKHFFFSYQNPIDHSVLKELLKPIRDLFSDVKRKALMRLEYEGLHKAEAITTPGARFYKDPAGFAMDRYAYYVCYKCKKVFQQYMSIYTRVHVDYVMLVITHVFM